MKVVKAPAPKGRSDRSLILLVGLAVAVDQLAARPTMSAFSSPVALDATVRRMVETVLLIRVPVDVHFSSP